MFVPYSVRSLYTDADNVPVALHEIGNATWVVVPQKPEKCWLVILHFDLSPFTMQCNLVMAKAVMLCSAEGNHGYIVTIDSQTHRSGK